MSQPVSILKGTVFLAVAGLIVKILGAVYRIVLARLIGAEGIGLYQMAYPVYLVFLSLSTAGIPIALSKLIAEKEIQQDYGGVRQIFRGAFLLLFNLGLLCSMAMGLSAGWLAERVVADPRAVYPILALTPAIFLMSLIAVFRGYFQGKRLMGLSGGSQIIEQAVRVGVAIILSFLLLQQGVEHAAAGAAFGATAGGAAGLLYLLLAYSKTKRLREKNGFKGDLFKTIKRIVRFALPISIAVILMPLLQTLDSVIVPAKLQSIGYSVKQATTMLGILGNSWAVLYLPMIVTGAIASNLVPVVASLNVIKKSEVLNSKIQNGFRLGMIWLIPCATGFYWFGNLAFKILFGIPGVDILSWFAPAVVFLGLEQISAGVWQGLGKPFRPLINFGIGAVVKVLVTLATTGWPGLNLAGAALGTVCGSGVTATLNLITLRYLGKIKIEFKHPCYAGIVMFAACGYLLKTLRFNIIGEMIVAGGGSFLIYLSALRFLGGIENSDLEIIGRFFMKRRTRNV